jgi:hypothetical protein
MMKGENGAAKGTTAWSGRPDSNLSRLAGVSERSEREPAGEIPSERSESRDLAVSTIPAGVGAGDRDRTGDIQLGKLTFYH